MEERTFCDVCRVRLRCELQYRDHLKNRMHKRKLVQKLLESCSTAAPSEADHLMFGREAHLRMLEVTSPAELAAFGKAARAIQRAFRKHRGAGGGVRAGQPQMSIL